MGTAHLLQGRNNAVEIIDGIAKGQTISKLNIPVSEPVSSGVNGYWTLVTGPDGSNEESDESNLEDETPNKIIKMIDAQEYYTSWTEVQYGNENVEHHTVRSSGKAQKSN